MPCVVIGGGLTAIDTATEVMAFYPLQVEKILDRYQALGASSGEFAVRRVFDEEELALLDEFLAHGHEVRAERARAAAAGEKRRTSCRSCGDGAACRSCTARACSTPPPTG